MLKLAKDISMVPKGLRYKTMIGFSLMSLIPIMVCAWIVITYIFPNINLFFGLSLSNISFILVICIIISMLGLYITKEMIDPVIKMAGDAKIIAEGGAINIIDINREDEVGDLSKSLNIMTQKIKDNMEELKTYGEKTKLINIEINKKVIALSGLLQIGNVISSSKELKNTLDFITQKVSDVEYNSVSVLLLAEDGANEYSLASSCNLEEGKALGEKVKQSEVSHDCLMNRFGLKNIVSIPVTVVGKLCGMLVVGNNEKDFIFADDEKELLKVFAKQISIAVENDMLIKKSKELTTKDEMTSLYNYSYMKPRLDEEIKRALLYQRPCGYLLVDMDNFKDFSAANGQGKAEALLKEAGAILKSSVMEIDRVGRLRDDKFGIILPEKNKRQAAHVAEEIRKKIEDGLGRLARADKKLTVSVGVSENPIDGSTAEELMEKAERLVRNAKALGKNRVAV
ncbi:MAG: diguanylate cyclase [Candidatus Omnitrophota bacterium]|nr:diguanylate cyclase [Candidatus Omnitrophota bacterium]